MAKVVSRDERGRIGERSTHVVALRTEEVSVLFHPFSRGAYADPIYGPGDAEVTLTEYSDFECPFCARAAPVTRQLVKDMEGKLCLAFRHFPLVHIHPYAELAARAATAAGFQGRFWRMHDYLFEKRDGIDYQALPNCAAELGLDADQFARDLDSQAVAEKIRHDVKSGERAGVRGTPSFFVNGRPFAGPWSYETLREAIEGQLGARRPVRRLLHRFHRHRGP